MVPWILTKYKDRLFSVKPYGMTLLTFLPSNVETIMIDFSITDFGFNCSLPSTLVSVEDDPKFVTTSDQQSK